MKTSVYRRFRFSGCRTLSLREGCGLIFLRAISFLSSYRRHLPACFSPGQRRHNVARRMSQGKNSGRRVSACCFGGQSFSSDNSTGASAPYRLPDIPSLGPAGTPGNSSGRNVPRRNFGRQGPAVTPPGTGNTKTAAPCPLASCESPRGSPPDENALRIAHADAPRRTAPHPARCIS